MIASTGGAMDELRRIRKERGLSQQRLAELAKVDKVTIVHIEGDKVSPKVETLEKLATALSVELADLFPKAQASLPLEGGGASSEPRVVAGQANLAGSGSLRAEGVVKEIMQAVDKYTAGEISRGKLEEQVRRELVPA
jgi:DNA-binding XRE family transcriptional regulator